MNWKYYKRIFAAYVKGGNSQLSFWHEVPAVNEEAFSKDSDQFYMTFFDKTNYAGLYDDAGVPMLDYRGAIGVQYNPIAIAQYGLGCFNRWRCEGDEQWFAKAKGVADWLVENLVQNEKGQWVWMHLFDWEYFKMLKAPWYSGLAQGQGLALLVRMAAVTEQAVYMDATKRAFECLVTPIASGGTLFVDDTGDWWIEEYITDPVTHILNGMMWALWGVYDYWTATDDERAKELWERSLVTLDKNLERFDCGFWSLYDAAPVRLKNPASAFYHDLHVVQLDVMWRLSGFEFFETYCERWMEYRSRWFCRKRAFVEKVVFKLVHY